MEWKTSSGLVPYEEAVSAMETRVREIREGNADELVWLLEHPPLYTAGSSAQEKDLRGVPRFPIYKTGRGGQYTYHGPGQRVAYVMLDLQKRKPDVRAFVGGLEKWLICTLADLGIQGFTREGRIGVWVNTPSGEEAKIAALGIRVRRWVTYHGISLNVAPDLGHYGDIVPCGIREYGVTSIAALGGKADMKAADKALQDAFGKIFKY